MDEKMSEELSIYYEQDADLNLLKGKKNGKNYLRIKQGMII